MCNAEWSKYLTMCIPGSYLPTTISRGRLLASRTLAVITFTAYVYMQIHVLSSPSPKVLKPYSPNVYFVTANFAASTLLNIYWLRQLFFRWDYAGDTMPLAYGWDNDSFDHMKLEGAPFHPLITKLHGLSSAQVSCLPFHILGSIFLTASSVAWLRGHLIISQILLGANLSVQLYTVFFLLHAEHDEHITPINYLTHIAMKTNAGLAVLYMWKNWGFIDMASPPTAQMINSGVIFLLMTIGSGPDPTVGLCLLYDLTALVFGQPISEPWYHTFHWIMIVICICLLVELHLSERRQFSWLKGFDVYVPCPRKRVDENIERQPKHRSISLWNDAAMPPYFPSTT